MADLHARQLAFLLERRIQINTIAFSPRQGGTMLLICLSAEGDVTNQEISLISLLRQGAASPVPIRGDFVPYGGNKLGWQQQVLNMDRIELLRSHQAMELLLEESLRTNTTQGCRITVTHRTCWPIVPRWGSGQQVIRARR